MATARSRYFIAAIFLGLFLVASQWGDVFAAGTTATFSHPALGVTKIVARSAQVISFQVSSVASTKNNITITIKTQCQGDIGAPTTAMSGSTLDITFALSSANCTNFTFASIVTYPESIVEVCKVDNDEWCADAYYRALPPDSPWNFRTVTPGYVYDQTQGLMWTAQMIGEFTNPNCCGYDPDGDQASVDAAAAACGNLAYGGLTWRLPSRSELHRLMDHAHVHPAINTTFFTLNYSYSLWTSDRSPVQDYVWVGYGIYASDGGITYNGDMDKIQGAFCTATVVAKTKPLEGQYQVLSSSVVHDSYTGLDWTRFSDNNEFKGPGIAAPTQYCADMSVDGLSDWRLPTIKELVSIHPDNNNPRGPLWNHTVFATFKDNVFWWASTPNKLLDGYYWAWTNGDGCAYINVNPGHARCVRGTPHAYNTVDLIRSDGTRTTVLLPAIAFAFIFGSIIDPLH